MAILTSKANGILTIEFDRVDRKNAITSAMYQTMADTINAAETDAEVRAILFTGKPEIFTATLGAAAKIVMASRQPSNSSGLRVRGRPV